MGRKRLKSNVKSLAIGIGYSSKIAFRLVKDRRAEVKEVYTNSRGYREAAGILRIAEEFGCSPHTARSALEKAVKGYYDATKGVLINGALSPDEQEAVALEHRKRNGRESLDEHARKKSGQKTAYNREEIVWYGSLLKELLNLSSNPDFIRNDGRVNNKKIAGVIGSIIGRIVEPSHIAYALNKYRNRKC